MIKDMFFVLRMLLFTVLVVIVMQVHIGDKSIEDNFHQWVKRSIVVDYIEEGIEGGMMLFKTCYKKADSGIHILLSKLTRKHQNKDRGIGFVLKRHDQKNDDYENDEDIGRPANRPQADVHLRQIH